MIVIVYKYRVIRVWIDKFDEEGLDIARGFLDGLDEEYRGLELLSEDEVKRIVKESDIIKKKGLLLRAFKRLPRSVRSRIVGLIGQSRLLAVLREE